MNNNPPGMFRGAFWEADFLSQTGFETLVNHMKEGQRSCKWVEDYLKQRAKAEEEYSKSLLKISRIERGASECTTLRKTLDEFRAEAETEATLHATLSQKISEETAKLTEFREKQKEERKRHEDTVHRAHKNKADLYRKMQACKNSYESKSKAADKAESDSEKMKFGSKPRDAEKARKSAMQARSNAIKSDEDYKSSVAAVENARQIWVRDHTESCDVLQKLEEERIQFVRNTVWVFTNLVSDLCCRLDDSRERIRAVTEQCDEVADIREFIAQKSTCISPLLPVEYVSFGSNESNASHLETHKPLSNGGHHYDADQVPLSAGGGMFKVMYDYTPNSTDEIALQAGDSIKCVSSASVDDGWMTGLNLRTKQTGLVPRNYVQST
uniref:Proline-serine-threonine phosphatase-interacting protein 1 n=1 Tax=Phallusia mammillata TaxID=59560 RepID=A0A6F9DP93_9ASCI|nr:proline-serine-threonine phosphatase-interacting protein 1 [Phallusia mammillata]